MAGSVGDESAAGRSLEGLSSVRDSQYGEAMKEWQSSEQVENGMPSTCSAYWDTDDTDDDVGWSHLAQFTIAVVNNDPKKSKYSDTLHRFWKKEQDWGWKKFMELSKVSDEFVDADTLIVKAKVQAVRVMPQDTLDKYSQKKTRWMA